MKTILIIEDGAVAGELLARALQGETEIRVVKTLAQASAAIAGSLPDLILSDLQLGAGNAESTIAFLRPFARRVPIVICTGHFGTAAGDGFRAACFRSGFQDYLDKFDERLVSPTLLLRTLQESFDRFHALLD